MNPRRRTTILTVSIPQDDRTWLWEEYPTHERSRLRQQESCGASSGNDQSTLHFFSKSLREFWNPLVRWPCWSDSTILFSKATRHKTVTLWMLLGDSNAFGCLKIQCRPMDGPNCNASIQAEWSVVRGVRCQCLAALPSNREVLYLAAFGGLIAVCTIV